MKLVENWKECWRWYSMHTSFIGFIFTTAASSIVMSGAAVTWFGMFDVGVVLMIASAIFVANMIGRLIIQRRKIVKAERAKKRESE